METGFGEALVRTGSKVKTKVNGERLPIRTLISLRSHLLKQALWSS